MVHYCVAFGCEHSDTEENRGKWISFHRFPKDPDRHKAWIVALRRDKFKPNDESRLCSVHFTQNDFDTNSAQRKILKKGTIPSVFPKFPAHLQPKIEKRAPPKLRQELPAKKAKVGAASFADKPF